jgi:cell division protein FtsN
VTSSRTLSRDFKHVKRHAPGGQTFSGWMGLMVGLAVGLTVALGVFLHYRSQPPAEPQPVATASPASAKASDEAPPVPVDPARDYAFYDMLPAQEVEVPESASKQGAAASVLPKGDVVLQAGAFKQADEADKLKARLAQYGVDAKIQRFSLDDETWFRVRIGPIATVEELENVRARLAEAEVEATPVAPIAETPLP